MKKYLLLIPTLFVMLLNCITFGQVVAADEVNDYRQLFLDPADLLPFDCSDSDAISTFIVDESVSSFSHLHRYVRSKYGDKFLSLDNYFYCVFRYINPNDHCLYYSVAFFESAFSEPVSITDDRYYFYEGTFSVIQDVTYSPSQGLSLVKIHIASGTFANAYDCGQPVYLKYDSVTGQFAFDRSSSPASFSKSIPGDYEIYYQGSNIPDFPFADGVNCSGVSSDELKVDVNFDPELTTGFDRRIKNGLGSSMLETLNVKIQNNSNFPIQFSWFIVLEGHYFSLYDPNPMSFSDPNGKGYVGDPAYAYVTDEWCYLPKHNGTNKKGIVNTYSPSTWHYLAAGSSDDITVSFSQMNIVKDVIYDVYVYAIRNDTDAVCVIPFNGSSVLQYDEDYIIDFSKAECVYSSKFGMINPAEFDPSLTYNGSYAFDPSDSTLFNRASGYIDENGEVHIEKIDTDKLANDPNGWGNKFDSDAWDNYYKKQNTVSSDLDQLSYNFSSYFRFLNTVFGYFPKNFQSLISLGLISFVVLGILKVVI